MAVRVLRTVGNLAADQRSAIHELVKRGGLRVTGFKVQESFSETGNGRLIDGFPITLTANFGNQDKPLIHTIDATVQGMGRPVCQLPHAKERYGAYACAHLYEHDWHARNLQELLRMGREGVYPKINFFADDFSTSLEFLVSVNDVVLMPCKTKNVGMIVTAKVCADGAVGVQSADTINREIVSNHETWVQSLGSAVQSLNEG